MKKRIISLGLFGFPIGITIGFMIPLIISICIGDGTFYPVAPGLIDTIGNELNAVIIQTVLSGFVGSGFAVASVIWEIDSWSLAKQTGIYFIATCAIMFPIAYFANWMHHSIIGILSYIGIFIGIFVFVWIVQYFIWKSRIKRMNDGVKKVN